MFKYWKVKTYKPLICNVDTTMKRSDYGGIGMGGDKYE